MGATLPPKENNLFKLVVKSYETKQYKKGLKAADQVLKKFPEHGETLAMKGLTLNCLERKEEAYDYVRRGLKNDLKSHVCWHVYGLLYRADRNYREAAKCYRNALKHDPGNNQILRDLANLQVQLRDTAGFVETRRELLTTKPNNKNNWLAFAIAQHLSGRQHVAVEIITAYEKTVEEYLDSERYEHSEMLLYKAMLMEEAGQFEQALRQLKENSDQIVDKLSIREQRAALLLKLNRNAEAEKEYRYLLAINSDNYNYYRGLEAALGLQASSAGTWDDNQVAKLKTLYKELLERFPRSAAVKRIPLDFIEGEDFRKAISQYLPAFLRKGVPSLYSDLKPLYNQPGKAAIMDDVFKRFETSLREEGRFPAESSSSSTDPEPPTTLLWTLFLLAQHYDRRRLYDVALEKVEEAIKHTPTVPDLYLVKARILRHGGDAPAAAALAEEARSLDLADRYLNNEAVKRFLGADQVEDAERTAALFTKDGEQHNSLFDMQCMWYEVASGDSHLRQSAYGKALKKYLAIEKHYADMIEDQFDFHTYCLRKMTLRAYIKMLRMEDHLHSFKFFCKGAAGAIRTYIALFDKPAQGDNDDADGANSGLSALERKKLRAKQRKAEAKAKKAEETKREEEEKAAAAAAAAAAKEKGGKKPKAEAVKPADPDPHGDKLAQVEDPLSESVQYLQLLQQHAAQAIETHLLAFELYIRKKKLLLALQAVKRLVSIDVTHPDVHRSLVTLFHTVDTSPAPDSESAELVHRVIAEERKEITALAGQSLQEYNEAFLKEHSGSLLHRAAAAEVVVLLDCSRTAEAVGIVEEASARGAGKDEALAEGVKTWELKDCIRVHRLLQQKLGDAKAAARWKERCSGYFPYSTYFQGPKSSGVVGLPVSQVQHPELLPEENAGKLANGAATAVENLHI
ncbi:N-terminal acetyltransferase [Klebsormidium nitens]|uniref:N-terminal acetyltransferase n=1 Tax=Klebsormidium nitens TaxID=105231 RepID=A0A1Y1IHR1_KLENI|nr:N-terminal acetyltransferase [Klebsormidium nitens]|eukprot:GAQ88611.1 N-terminal acetyltransferase [Klebsormidium nitens]